MISRRGFILTWVMLVAVMALGQQFTTCISNNTNYQAYELNVDTWRNRQKTLTIAAPNAESDLNVRAMSTTSTRQSSNGVAISMPMPQCHQVAISTPSIQPIGSDNIAPVRRKTNQMDDDDDDDDDTPPGHNPGDPGDPMPIGSAFALLACCMLYALSILLKTKHNTRINRP